MNTTIEYFPESEIFSIDEVPEAQDTLSILSMAGPHDVALQAQQRLDQCHFKVSESQPDTPKDGNCFLHGIVDQMSYGYDPVWSNIPLTVDMLRKMVVGSLERMISNGSIQFPYTSKDEWIEKYSRNGEPVDHLFVQLTANLLNRKIQIIPVKSEVETTIFPPGGQQEDSEPLYMLYYEELYFGTGHYQSIRPI